MGTRHARTARIPLLALVAALVPLGCVTSRVLHDRAIEHNRTGVDRLAGGDLDGAEVAFRLALEYDHRFSEPYANLAVVAIERGDLDDAEEMLNRSLRLNPDFAAAWANLGTLRLRRGDPAGALAAYREALGADPDHHDARYNLVLAALDLGDIRLAEEQVGRLGVASPDDPAVLALTAFVAVQSGDTVRALRLAIRALEIESDQPLALFTAGLALSDQGMCDAALVVLDRALERGESLGPLLAAGGCFLETRRYDLAYNVFARALVLDAGNLTAWMGLGWSAIALGNVEAGAAVAERLERLAPRSYQTAVLAAAVDLARGEGDRAGTRLRALRERSDLDPALRADLDRLFADSETSSPR